MRRLAVLAVALVAGCSLVSPQRPSTPSTTTSTAVSATPTKPDPTGSLDFSAVGDFSATKAAAAVLSAVGDRPDDLMVMLGDLSYGKPGGEPAWCRFVAQRVPTERPIVLAVGNHESDGSNGEYREFIACLPHDLPGIVGDYGRRWYVDVPADDPLVRFVMVSPGIAFPEGIDSYAAGTTEFIWTQEVIDSARGAGIPWVIVGMHTPCLSVGQHDCQPGADLTTMLVDRKVPLVLNGHEHVYQRTSQVAVGSACPSIVPDTFDSDCVVDTDGQLQASLGTTFVTVGTGGRALYEVNLDDSEARYFDVVEGANHNGAYGSLRLHLTAAELTADFEPVLGATFTDHFSITR